MLETGKGDEKARVNAQLGIKWILNLSMHFRDDSSPKSARISIQRMI